MFNKFQRIFQGIGLLLGVAMLGNAFGQPPVPAGAPPAGFGLAGDPNLPPNLFASPHRLTNSPLSRRWIYIPMGAGKTLRTLVIEPAGDAPAPVVVLMHYDAGLDDLQQALANQLAVAGFIAVAPDLLSGRGPNGGNYDSFAFPDAALRAVWQVPLNEAMQRYKLAYAFAKQLPRGNGKIASFGCGLGGTHSFQFASEEPDLSAAVVYYGLPPSRSALAHIHAPVLGLYGSDDAPVDGTIDATAAAMKSLGKNYESHIYPGATHFFMSYAIEAQNGPAINAAWTQAVAFLKEHTMAGRPVRGT